MASFTDAIVQFNPYIKEIPESLDKVGMIKQAQYDKNVQAIDAGIERMYNLPLMQNASKEYVKQKTDAMVAGLNKYLSNADFSNQSIVNQVGQYASEILNDRTIRSHIQNSSRVQSDLALMAEAKKTGKDYGVENEAMLNKAVSRYINGGVDSQYNGEYVPFTDVRAKVIDAWSKMHPDEKLVQQITPHGTSFVIMKGTEKVRTISEHEVLNSLNTVLTGTEIRQLNITGAYNTSGISGESFINSYYEIEDKRVDAEIKQHEAELKTGVSEGDKKIINERLEYLKKRKEEVKKDKQKDLESIKDEDPQKAADKEEQVKARLWTEGWKHGMAEMVSYRQTESTLQVDTEYMKLMYPDLYRDKSKDPKEETNPNFVPTVNVDDIKAKNYSTFLADHNAAVDANHARKDALLFRMTVDPDGNSPIVNAEALKNADGTSTTIYKIKKGQEKEAEKLWSTAYKKWLDGDPNLDIVIASELRSIDENAKINGARSQILNSIHKDWNLEIDRRVPKIKDGKYKIWHEDKEHSFNVTNEKLKRFVYVLEEIPKFPKLGKGAVFGLAGSGKSEEIPVDPKAMDSLLVKYGFSKAEFQTYQRAQNNPLFAPIIEKLKETNLDRSNFYNTKVGQFQQKLNIQTQVLSPEMLKKGGLNTFKAVVGEYAQALDSLEGVKSSDILAAFAKDEKEWPTIGYTQDEQGNAYFRVYNVDKKHPVTSVKVPTTTAQSMGLYQNDPFRVARALLAANKGLFTGVSELQAIDMPVQGKAKAKYQLNEISPNQYKLTFYLTNNGKKRTFVDNQKSYSWADLDAIIPMLNETSIDAFVRGDSQTPLTTVGSMSSFPTQVLNTTPPQAK